MLLGSPLSGAIIARIIGIHAIGNVCKSKLCAQRSHHVEELVLAVEAAIRVIALILGPLQFVCGHHVQRHIDGVSKSARLLQIPTRQAGRICQHRKHLRAQNAMCSRGQESGIHTPRVGHHQTTQFHQARFQRRQPRSSHLAVDFNSCRHGPDYTPCHVPHPRPRSSAVG